ncbi:10359fae-171a-40e0-ad45-405a8fa4f32b [Sclerotinia trifoliorum]|uniref:10359fae-171a-40e0-ad45-405a8fa4f32b n=1 Tax=Sclerotinia trifoliorum TaxID=28548 RepID=A0A8H2ZUB9_9HELO|nr:10359fae-171a-40e0-ad45-405a8fa4f32b [Sclerotinia trifoliorum]
MNSSSPLSSPLSSIGTISQPPSPSPTADYPSPPCSSVPDTRVPSEAGDAPDCDGPPPAKRRKMTQPKSTEPKPRTTEYLDLRNFGEGSEEQIAQQDAQMKRLVRVLRGKRKIVVVAGAGISVSAGIPDFRSSTGLFSSLRSQHKLKSSGKELFDASVYKDDSSTTSFHSMVRELSHLTKNAKATPFHHMLATLAEEGRLLRLYSQNVDGIDTSLEPLATRVPLNTKGPWPKTIQLHGGLAKMVCSKCGHLEDFDGALFEGPEAPDCGNCVEIDSVRIAAGSRRHGIGRMRPRMVLYNEYNPDEEAIGAVSAADLKKVADAVIVVGTSLKIPGIRRLVKEMCSTTRDRKNGFTAWINLDGEPGGPEFKDCWDMIVRGECDEVARHAGLPKWDDKDLGQYTVVANEGGSAKKRGIDKVLVTPARTTAAADAFPTPGASPRMQSPTPTNAFSKLKAITKPKGTVKKTTATKSTKRKTPIDPKVKKPRAPPKPKTSSKLKKQILPGENLKLSMTTTKSLGTGETKTLGKDNPRKKLPSKPEIIEPAKLENPFLGSSTSALFPNLRPAVPVVAIPLPTTRPETTPARKVSTLPTRRQESNPPIRVKSSRLSDTHTIPETPSPSRSPNIITFDRNETITPPSIPKNMDLLIDH